MTITFGIVDSRRRTLNLWQEFKLESSVNIAGERQPVLMTKLFKNSAVDNWPVYDLAGDIFHTFVDCFY
jgi:hypothetical protein